MYTSSTQPERYHAIVLPIEWQVPVYFRWIELSKTLLLNYIYPSTTTPKLRRTLPLPFKLLNPFHLTKISDRELRPTAAQFLLSCPDSTMNTSEVLNSHLNILCMICSGTSKNDAKKAPMLLLGGSGSSTARRFWVLFVRKATTSNWIINQVREEKGEGDRMTERASYDAFFLRKSGLL